MADYQSSYPWLQKSLFQDILRRDQDNNSIYVNDLLVTSALGPGENYCSQILRVKANYRDETTGVSAEFTFVVKALPKTELACDVVKELGAFQKEIVNFETVLPAVQALLESIGDRTVLAPKCYSSSLEDSYLVLEDMSAKGFTNLNRRDGLRVEDFQLVFNAAAKWHAATAVLLQKNPSIFDIFRGPKMMKTCAPWRKLIDNFSMAVVDACRELPRFHHLADKLDAGHNTVYDRICDVVESDTESLKVLNHGDLWCNNVMFIRDGCSSSVVLVDFQISTINTPVLDIIFALFTSSHEDISETDWDDIVQGYHKELSDCLKRLGFAGHIPTLTELHMEMLRKGIYGAFFGLSLFGLRNVPVDSDADMNVGVGDREKDREFRKQVFLMPSARKGLELLLNYFERKGFFEL